MLLLPSVLVSYSIVKDEKYPKGSIMKQSPILIALLIGVTTGAQAQPTLNALNDYQAPTERTYWSGDPSVVPADLTGEGRIWNFADWSQNSTLKQEVLDPANAPNGDAFPQADLAVTLGAVERYYQTSSNGNELYGFKGSQSGQEVQIEYLQPVQPYKRPFPYSDVQQDDGRRQYQVGAMGFTLDVTGSGTSTTEAIGSGTLQLPDQTYESTVLLRNKQTWQDSASVPFRGTTVINNTMISYTWYQPDRAYPIVRLDSLTLESESSFVENQSTATLAFYKSSPTGVAQQAKSAPAAKAYISNGQLNLKTDADRSQNLQLTLRTIHGKPIRQYQTSVAAGPQRQTFSLPPVASGIYILRAVPERNDQQPFTRKIRIR